MLEDELFNRYTMCNEKLLSYGFEFVDGVYNFKKYILNNSFLISISISNSFVCGKVFDLDFNSEYTSFRIEDFNGSFAGIIKEEFEKLLLDIRDKCFTLKMFVSDQANRISGMIKEKFGDLPFYEWESSPNTGVFKNIITKKWYAIIMNVKKSRVCSCDNDSFVDVINLKIDPEKIVDFFKLPGYYPAYHMNKKYWISIILDGTVSDSEIIDFVEESYRFSSNKK